ERSAPTGLNAGLGASPVGEAFCDDCARAMPGTETAPASPASPFEKFLRDIFMSGHGRRMGGLLPHVRGRRDELLHVRPRTATLDAALALDHRHREIDRALLRSLSLLGGPDLERMRS